MKRLINILLVAVLAIPAFIRCSDWTEVEALKYDPHMTDANHGEKYYANLRAYKAEKHPVAFGWFSDWTGVGTKMTSQLMGLPDSMDFVSMWGNWYGLSDEKKADLRKVQTIKGTRVLMCFIVDNVGAQTTPADVRKPQQVPVLNPETGEPMLGPDNTPLTESAYVVNGKYYYSENDALAAFWGWYGGTVFDENGDRVYDSEQVELAKDKAIRKYAHSLLDTIAKYNWDGFDLDLEPNYGHYGNLASYPDHLSILLDELSKYLGPKSGTRKMLCVDGEPDTLNPEDGALLNYFILQAYNDGYESSIDSRLNRLINNFSGVLTTEQVIGMTILTSNFESYGSTGGPNFTLDNGTRVNQLKGYALYSYPGVNVKIGGIGAYRIGFDTDYKYLREAMGILNPVIK